jgi:acyl-CoA thioesterase FadM
MQHAFTPPKAAFTRSVPIRFSHCDSAGIVYFPHYFNMFNGLVPARLSSARRSTRTVLPCGRRRIEGSL